jgi:general secretion pathway protein D
MTVSFEHVLRWLCRFCHVTYTLRDHAILVTSKGGLLDQPITRSYDVAGLLVPGLTIRTAFEGGAQTTDEQAGRLLGNGAATVKEDAAPKDVVGEGWAQFIRSTVAFGTWERPSEGVAQEKAQYTIAYRNGRIVVVHTPEVQEQVEKLLDNFRKARNLQVSIHARFIELTTDFLETININWGDLDADPVIQGFGSPAINAATGRHWQMAGTDMNEPPNAIVQDGLANDGGLSLHYSYLGRDQVDAFLTAVVKHRRGTLLVSPRLTCFNTQRANFQAVTNYNYLRSISADNEPEIGNVPDGIVFDVQPFVSADRRHITLVLQPQMRTLRTPIREFQYVTGVRERFVQLPEVQLKSVATTVTIPDGGTLLVGGLAKVNEQAAYATFPFVTGIPFLKHLFRSWQEAERRQSLIILVTGQIVPDIFEE